MFAGAGWGWRIETAVHVLRIILSGVFDRIPNLELIVGHMGETLPFMMSRVDVMTPCFRWAPGGSCSPPTTLTDRSPRHALSGKIAGQSRRRDSQFTLLTVYDVIQEPDSAVPGRVIDV
jgi:hypothetical protein